MEEFCKILPKIELHAHLNGSLSDSTLRLLQSMKSGSSDENDRNISEYKIVTGTSRTLIDCFGIFKLAQALTDNAESVTLATANTLLEFHNDGVIYLELRSTPRENDTMSKKQYVKAMVEGVIAATQQISMKTCLLISIDRRNSLAFASETVNLAISMNRRYPDIVVGIDLSGDPTVGKFSDLAAIMEKGRKAGLKVTIHAAEIPNEAETMEILRWKPDRLGHMTCCTEEIMGSKTVWNTVIESRIPIELCLTSNVKCRSVLTYEDHHFKLFYKLLHPISIATDDKGVFNTSLSEELFILANTFNLSKVELFNLSRNAVYQCFGSEAVKNDLFYQFANFKENIMDN